MTNAVYPNPEERDGLYHWLSRSLPESMRFDVDPFGWCRRNLGLMALWHLDRGPEDQPGPWTIQDAFGWMAEGLRR